MGIISGTIKGITIIGVMGALVTYVDQADLTDPMVAMIKGQAPVHYTYEKNLQNIEEITESAQKYHPRLIDLATGIMKEEPIQYEDNILEINRAYTKRGGVEAALKQFEYLDKEIKQELMTRNQKSYMKNISEDVYENLKEKLDQAKDYMR
ncbi:MAG: hypothetical protein ACLFP2_04795 [Candidatus Woesearchaeota archaeon]